MLGAAGALAACSVAPPVSTAATSDWIEFGNTVRSYDETQLESEYLIADESYRLAPSSAAAIRLALLAADARNRYHDPGRALMLLEGVAADSTASPEDLEFARFLRPWLADLIDSEAALAQAVEDKQALETRLDALVDLERRLNAESLE